MVHRRFQRAMAKILTNGLECTWVAIEHDLCAERPKLMCGHLEAEVPLYRAVDEPRDCGVSLPPSVTIIEEKYRTLAD
jgi:hypothetical protein